MSVIRHEVLSGETWERLFRPAVGTRPPRGWTCAKATEHLVLYEQDQPVSFIGFLERIADVDGTQTTIGGLGFGATSRGFERRGYMTTLTEEALRLLASRGRETVVITCLDTLRLHYTRLGWTPVSCPVRIQQPNGETTVPEQVYVFAHGRTPQRSLDLRGLPW